MKFRIALAVVLVTGCLMGCQDPVILEEDNSASPQLVTRTVTVSLPISDSAVFPDTVKWRTSGGWTPVQVVDTVVADSLKFRFPVQIPGTTPSLTVQWYRSGFLLRTVQYDLTTGRKSVTTDSSQLVAFSVKRNFDPNLVPKARFHGGTFVSAVADTLIAPTPDASVWWGFDSANLQSLPKNGVLWIDRTCGFWVQARRGSVIGPKVYHLFTIKNTLNFIAPNPDAIYNGTDENSQKLRRAGVQGWAWAYTRPNESMGVSEFDAISMTTDAVPRLSLALQLRGTDAAVGVGVQLGGAIDSIGPLEKGKWALDLRPASHVLVKFQMRADSVDLSLEIGSMDSTYNLACASGVCLRYKLKPSEISAGYADIPIGALSYPSWSGGDTATKWRLPPRSEILRKASGVGLTVAGRRPYSSPVPVTLLIENFTFVTQAVAPDPAWTKVFP